MNYREICDDTGLAENYESSLLHGTYQLEVDDESCGDI